MNENSAPDHLPRAGLSRRRMLSAAGLVSVAGAAAACSSGTSATSAASSGSGHSGQTFYWVSHGAPADQVWVIANQGATQAGKDFGANVRISFHNNDVASQKEALTSAIAAKATGIATSSPEPKVLDDVVAQATQAGIPVVTFNSDDTTASRLAYVGADLTTAGTIWANYLLDNGLVKPGDTVWLPVEAAGASYQVLETSGIKSVFGAKNISVEVFQAGSDPAGSTSAMQNYLTAHQGSVKAMIGLGDQVTSNVENVFKALGWAPGKIPVVGWGNTKATAQAVSGGYVSAALWQYPDSQGYLPIALLKMYKDGLAVGYDVPTMALYTKETVSSYEKFLK
jgi:simple sugar transport system substrate-binding protein